MRRLIVLPFLALALASSPGPQYPDWTQYLLSAPDYRLDQVLKVRWPYVEVLRKDRLREYQRGPCDPAKDPGGCRDRMPWPQAQAHEFRLPLSSLEATREVARDLRKAWQRFEERYYWRVITELNNPAFWFAYCAVGLKGPDLMPSAELVDILVPSEALDPALKDKLPADTNWGKWASAGKHRLENYYPVPQIPREDFCDDLGMNLLPIMYIPGFKILIQGQEIFRTPGYPSRPLWFNEAEANARVERAMQHVWERYYPQYLEETSRILLTPRPSDPASFLSSLGLTDYRNLGAPKVYLPVPWQGHLLGGGAVVAPVYTELVPRDPRRLENELRQINFWMHYVVNKAGSELEKLYAYVHFYRALERLFNSKAVFGIPGMDAVKAALRSFLDRAVRITLGAIPATRACTGDLDAVMSCATRALMGVDALIKAGKDVAYLTGGKPMGEPIKGERESPGLWKFEEAKRWLPPSSLPVYEAFGYTTFFQAMNLLEVTNIPDMRNLDLSKVDLGNWAGFAWSQLSRLIVYWHVPITVDIRVEYCPPCVLAYPSLPLEGPAQPLGVPPYTLPFAAERTHWRWVSVPEGYEIPGVRGTPYRVLGDLGGIGPDLSLLYRPLIGR